jgi:hypothetical protein
MLVHGLFIMPTHCVGYWSIILLTLKAYQTKQEEKCGYLGSSSPLWTGWIYQLQKSLDHVAVKCAHLVLCKAAVPIILLQSYRVPFMLKTDKFTSEYWVFYMNVVWNVNVLASARKKIWKKVSWGSSSLRKYYSESCH